jgi:hypothetical protein
MQRKVPGTKYIYNDNGDSPVPGQYGAIKLYAGSGSADLGREVAEYLNLQMSLQDLQRFSNENIFVRLQSSVRGQDVRVGTSTTVDVTLEVGAVSEVVEVKTAQGAELLWRRMQFEFGSEDLAHTNQRTGDSQIRQCVYICEDLKSVPLYTSRWGTSGLTILTIAAHIRL